MSFRVPAVLVVGGFCVCLAVLGPVALMPAAAQNTAPDADRVVAVVNGEEIRFGEVAAFVQSLPENYRRTPLAQLYPHVVDQLVSRKLIAAVAVKEGMESDEEYLRRRAVMQERLLHELYMQQHIEKELTETRLRARYDETVGTESGEAEVQARHILLETEDEAKAVIAELNGGADFAKVAKAKSTGPSASKGGDLGFFKRGDMVPPFAEMAFSLEAGAVSKTPVKTQFGWHVIKVEARRETAPPSFADSVAELRQELVATLASQLIDQARRGAEIKRFNLDGTPME